MDESFTFITHSSKCRTGQISQPNRSMKYKNNQTFFVMFYLIHAQRHICHIRPEREIERENTVQYLLVNQLKIRSPPRSTPSQNPLDIAPTVFPISTTSFSSYLLHTSFHHP